MNNDQEIEVIARFLTRNVTPTTLNMLVKDLTAAARGNPAEAAIRKLIASLESEHYLE